MRILFLSLFLACSSLLAFLPLVAAEPQLGGLYDVDKLQVREAQLVLSQAHITKLQADAQIREAESALAALVQSLKSRYACPDCELQSDLTWKRTPPATKPETPVQKATPAPPTASGQTSKKE